MSTIFAMLLRAVFATSLLAAVNAVRLDLQFEELQFEELGEELQEGSNKSGSDSVFGECLVNDEVWCLDRRSRCRGRSCCRDGTPCPSAPSDYRLCAKQDKAYDCTRRVGGKKGMAGPDVSKQVAALKSFKDHHIHWAHDHSVDAKGLLKNYPESVAFVPQIWGRQQFQWRELDRTANGPVLLGFDNPAQQSMDPAEAAGLWPQVEAAAKGMRAHTLVGPSVNWAGGPYGKPHEWYKKFFEVCPHCRVDALGIAVFNCDVDAIRERIDALDEHQRPVYITAFACGDNPERIEAEKGHANTDGSKSWWWQCEYLKDVIDFLDNDHRIKGYAWFSVGDPGAPNVWVGESALVNKAGVVTELGKCYFNAGRAHQHGLGSQPEHKHMQTHHGRLRRHAPLGGFDPVKAGACRTGERVQCPTTPSGQRRAYCVGKACCPDGTACPSAPPGWEGCAKKSKRTDCSHWPWSKMGIAHDNMAHKSELREINEHSNISWLADWVNHAEHHYSYFENTDITYVPMAWGSNERMVAEMLDAPILLGFNEPNDPSQSNLDPWTAARLWKQVEEAAVNHNVHTLVGPSLNHAVGAWSDPIVWYDKFLELCQGCRIDAVGLHVYTCTLEEMTRRVSAMKKYGKPIWLTEFACADDPQGIPGNHGGSKAWNWQCEYMQRVVPYLNSEDSVAAYAWFSYGAPGRAHGYVGESALLQDGRKTPLGRCYSELAGARESGGSPSPSPRRREPRRRWEQRRRSSSGGSSGGYSEPRRRSSAGGCGALSFSENAQCKSQVEWAWLYGRHESWAKSAYARMQEVTGMPIHEVSQDDMQRYWYCEMKHENPCGRPPCSCSKPPCDTCGAAPAAPKCGDDRHPENVGCGSDVRWAYDSGRKASWAASAYKRLPEVSGVDHSGATLQDFQRLWFCGVDGVQPSDKRCKRPPCGCSRPPCHTCPR